MVLFFKNSRCLTEEYSKKNYH